MGLPLHEAPSIRQTPLYVRWRHRMVSEMLKESKIRSASKAKAMGVIDFSNI